MILAGITIPTNYQLSTTNYQSPTINYQLSTINYQLSTINYQLSTINYQLSTTNYQLSIINYQLSIALNLFLLILFFNSKGQQEMTKQFYRKVPKDREGKNWYETLKKDFYLRYKI